VTPISDEPTAQAQAIMERLLVMVKDCRVVPRLSAVDQANHRAPEQSGFSITR